MTTRLSNKRALRVLAQNRAFLLYADGIKELSPGASHSLMMQ
jgi:hypothetical protein